MGKVGAFQHLYSKKGFSSKESDNLAQWISWGCKLFFYGKILWNSTENDLFSTELLNDPIGTQSALWWAVEVFKMNLISVKPTDSTLLKFYRPILLGFVIPEIQVKCGVHLPLTPNLKANWNRYHLMSEIARFSRANSAVKEMPWSAVALPLQALQVIFGFLFP